LRQADWQKIIGETLEEKRAGGSLKVSAMSVKMTASGKMTRKKAVKLNGNGRAKRRAVRRQNSSINGSASRNKVRVRKKKL